MQAAVSTLFLPVENGVLDSLGSGFNAAFLNAYPHEALRALKTKHLYLQQYFKPYAFMLQEQGYAVSSEIVQQECDVLFILLPKSMEEARCLIAQGLSLVKSDGLIFCAAGNKAGGTRIKKMLHDFGVSDINEISKNKSRVAWGSCQNVKNDLVKGTIKSGSMQSVLNGEYISMPGVFGWNKIDKGSEILLQHLPDNISGRVADFGCGYGYLSKNILEKYTGITELLCIDADYRAIKCCEENLKTLHLKTPQMFFWEDLTKPFADHHDLDFIIMNPPFHEGKTTDSDIGKAFIETAFKSLKSNGQLWMVANVALPYEHVLQAHFSSYECKYEGQGFKVFCAIK